ncbi:MAG: GNAT family N-acetyltransferase [Anaerolineae bacterium]|nr:GNAT family N-acetyltransferase [Anaerolineae bacterium]
MRSGAHNEWTIAIEKPNHPHALQLIQHLSAELASRYGDDGSGAFAPEDVQGPRAAFVVARLGARPVGCGALKPFDGMEPGTVAEIKRMFVEPDMRGRGIARQILGKLEQVAVDLGYNTLRLETGDKQPEAMGLYETSGFRRIACYGRYAAQSWSVCYEKRMGPQV